MTKILLTLATMTGAASYDASGKVVGRSATDSAGTVPKYDARGNVISREATSGNRTTINNASGRNVGRFTTSSR